MHFSFIKTLIKQVILFLFKEISASSLGSITSPGASYTPRHIPHFRSLSQDVLGSSIRGWSPLHWGLQQGFPRSQ